MSAKCYKLFAMGIALTARIPMFSGQNIKADKRSEIEFRILVIPKRLHGIYFSRLTGRYVAGDEEHCYKQSGGGRKCGQVAWLDTVEQAE